MAAKLPIIGSSDATDILSTIELVTSEIHTQMLEHNKLQVDLLNQGNLLQLEGNDVFERFAIKFDDIITAFGESVDAIGSPFINLINELLSEMDDEKDMRREEFSLLQNQMFEDREKKKDIIDASSSTKSTDDALEKAFADLGEFDFVLFKTLLVAGTLAYFTDMRDLLQNMATIITLKVGRIFNVRAVKTAMTPITKVMELIKTASKIFGRGMLTVLYPVIALGRGLKNVFMGVAEVFGVTSKVATGLGKVVSPITATLGFLGRGLRTIFGPFTLVLFGILDFFKGFIRGFKEGGLLEGFKQGTAEFFRGLIGIPLEFFKNIFAWVTSKLGFEEFALKVKDYNIADATYKFFKGTFDYIQKLFTNPGETVGKIITAVFGEQGIAGLFTNLFANFVLKISESLKALTTGELVADVIDFIKNAMLKLLEALKIGNIVESIKDDLAEKAKSLFGIDSDGPETDIRPDDSSRRRGSGNTLRQQRDKVEAAEKTAAKNVVVAPTTNNNSQVNVSNNRTQISQFISAAPKDSTFLAAQMTFTLK